jgi:hypothetical protein
MVLLNVPWDEAARAGPLFGTKLVLNEFVAFIDLGAAKDTLSPHTVAIVTFALCGFRELQLDRDPDGRDRQPRAQSAPGDRQARSARSGGRAR